MASSNAKSETLTGAQKSAVLCIALGPDGAAQILQQLEPEEVEQVTREIATMRTVPARVIESVVEEFRQATQAQGGDAQGGLRFARTALEQAMGAPRAEAIVGRIRDGQVDTGLKRLKQAAPEVLVGLLRGEHPQTIALILAHLDLGSAARVVQGMAPELASEVLLRVARMDKVSPEMVGLVEASLARKADLSLAAGMSESGGPGTVAGLLNLAPADLNKDLLDRIGLLNEDMAARIRSRMFVFEDLLRIDGKGIQRVLRDVDTKDLALSLKAASEELTQHIKSNMSGRAAEALDEEIEMLGPVRVKDVEAAHQRIIDAVRQLEDAGEIMVRRQGGGDDIIG